MPEMRAKVRITSIARYPNNEYPTEETLNFSYVIDEGRQLAKFTPSGSLSLTIANPALVGKIKEGDAFYIDFTRIT